jgi:hypothetical protein
VASNSDVEDLPIDMLDYEENVRGVEASGLDGSGLARRIST